MRGCAFEYAGVSSQDYGLILAFVGSSEDTLVSGGEFEIINDFTPHTSESLLYGKKFEKPLEFEVDIIGDEREYDQRELKEIKGWLFGQDGWKKFRYYGEGYEECYLKCLFSPVETIVGENHFLGLRCTLHNISAYWYQNEVKLEGNDFTWQYGDTPYKRTGLNIPPNHFIENIYPNIIITKDSVPDLSWMNFVIGTTTKGVDVDFKTCKGLNSGYTVIIPNNFSDNTGRIEINTKYSLAKHISSNGVETNISLKPIDGVTTFVLSSENDDLYLKNTSVYANYTYLKNLNVEIRYTPMIRFGGL